VLTKILCLCQGAVVFLVTVNVYAYEKSEIAETSMVALSGCIWLQAFLVALETNSFTWFQHMAVWGNVVLFYLVNLLLNLVEHSGMYTIMFRLCSQPAYWLSLLLIVIIGMGPLLALKYFRVMYRPSTVNMLQRLEHQYTNSLSVETPTKSLDVSLSMTRTTFNHGSELGSVYEPLLLPETPTFQKKSGDSEASSDSVPSSPTRVTLPTYSRSKNK
jgi:phospholipid-translocating ATPase